MSKPESVLQRARREYLDTLNAVGRVLDVDNDTAALFVRQLAIRGYTIEKMEA